MVNMFVVRYPTIELNKKKIKTSRNKHFIAETN